MMESMEFSVSEAVCEVIVMCATIAQILRGHIEICHLLAGATERKEYLSFFHFKANACLVEERVLGE